MDSIIRLCAEYVPVAQVVGTVLTAFSILVVSWRLYIDSSWNRRLFATNMIKEWNDSVRKHIMIIEKKYPHIVHKNPSTNQLEPIPKLDVKAIYETNASDPELWELRENIIELLNDLEFISIAWSRRVADRIIIYKSFKWQLVNWYKALKPFMEMTKSGRGEHPWSPFQEVVEHWNKD